MCVKLLRCSRIAKTVPYLQWSIAADSTILVSSFEEVLSVMDTEMLCQLHQLVIPDGVDPGKMGGEHVNLGGLFHGLKEITLDLLPTHCNRRGLFLLGGGFHLWLTSLSSELEIT